MTAAGTAKLIEEIGELQVELGQLQQVLGKRLAMWDQDEHWDGTNLRQRMVEEMGDVAAAMDFVAMQFGLSTTAIAQRRLHKLRLFGTWQEQIDNNDHGIDAQQGMTDELRGALFAWRRSLNTVGIPGENQAEDVLHLKIAVDAWRNSGRVHG